MAYNCDYDCKYYYPVNYQMPTYATTQCDPQSYYYWQCYYNAYQNQLRNLQNRQITMEYWTRQLEYFRNLLKNFSAVIETPADLKKLLATCGFDENTKKCFEKRRTFSKADDCNCCCKVCLKKTLLRLYNDFSAPWPCNKCYCSACCQKPSCQKQACAHQCQNPSAPCYYYVPCQMPANCSYYTCQQPAASPTCCNSQQMPNYCCPTNCNKCKFKYILNKINWILSSAEQLKCTCCACACSMPVKKSCCSIQEIKEETITIKRETDADKNKNNLNSVENSERARAPTPRRVSLNPECEYESSQKQNPNRKSRKHSESSKFHSNYSGTETIDDASNIPEEYKNYNLCVEKKQASIALGEEYISPSGTFEVLIQDQYNKRNTQNTDYVFEVDYTTYTKPKCSCENEM